MPSTPFDEAASTWDQQPRRVALAKAIGEAILREARPTRETSVFDYGCGTGLLGLYLLPHVASVTGADNSAGMLDVLRTKIAEGRFDNMKALQLDLQSDPAPDDRYEMVVTGMVMHHVADVSRVLRAFHRMLVPGGVLCLADLDTEPGNFHPPEVAASVHHHGFNREELKARLADLGFVGATDVTATTMRKETADNGEQKFPVFLITARRGE